MDPLAISRRLLLQRIASEEPAANTYNEEEVMLLLSEIYNDRLTSSEIDLLKIKPLKKTFRCKFCKSKFKKEVKYLSKDFSNFKQKLSESIITVLEPINLEMKKLLDDQNYLDSIISNGTIKARNIAKPVINEVYDKLGFLRT